MRLIACCILCLCLLISLSLAQPNENNKFVFAHYMLCCATYNATVQGYAAEILEAQAYGVDGFALNAGAWSNAINYVNAAAEQLNTSFQLFFSADMSGIKNASDVYDMVARFYNHPNQFKFQGKSVLSTYSGQASPWWIEGAFIPLKENNMSVYFVPDFSPFQYYASLDAQDYSFQNYLWEFYVDGLFNFAAAGLYLQNSLYTGLIGNSPPIQAGTRARGEVARKFNKTIMSGINPHYWGAKQPTAGRRYFEYGGGESLSSQWENIIERINPEWVEIVTWNDLDEEGYICPLLSGVLNPYVFQFSAHQAGGGNTSLNYYPSHRGTISLISYFISWFKYGQQPIPETDSFYWFYRKHSWQARATDDPFGPVTYFLGNVSDVIYITSILTSPAELLVECGENITSLFIPAGLFHSTAPFSPGLPKFTLSRNGEIILQAQGLDEIEAEPKYYNFHYSSNFASVDQNIIPAPTGLTGQAGIDSVSLQWDSNNEAISYIIKSSSSISGNYEIIYKTNYAYANISSLSSNSTIFFTVSALLNNGQTTIDSFPLSLTTNNFPDLIITSIQLDPPSPAANIFFQINATILNIGHGPLSLPLFVFFEIDANPGSYLYNNPPYSKIIYPGESVEIVGNHYYYGGNDLWNSTGNLIHSIKAVVNPFPPGYTTNIFPNSLVYETNFTNNEMVIDLPILPDLSILNVSTTPASPTSGESTVITVTIENDGLVAPINNTFISFFLDDEIFSSIPVSSLEVNSYSSESSPSFIWPSGGWSSLSISVNLYPIPVYQELTFANNVYPEQS